MVILITVSAGKVAAAHGNQMCQDGMARREQSAADETSLPQFELDEFTFPHATESLDSTALKQYPGAQTLTRRIGDPGLQRNRACLSCLNEKGP